MAKNALRFMPATCPDMTPGNYAQFQDPYKIDNQLLSLNGGEGRASRRPRVLKGRTRAASIACP